ncbi:MAG: carbohydrate transporter permease [Paenibacillus sp.]|jgi:putative aldouronate transport system permease protein|nr:carbohydrate transporter permease [Paenibacillus sp.]
MKPTFGELWFYRANYFVLTLIGLSCLLPLIYVLSVSLSDARAVMSGEIMLWPIGLNFISYQKLLVGTRVIQAFQNSVVITVVGVGLSMLFTILAAYPLSRKYFLGRRFFTLAIVFTMLFSGGLIPNYLVVKSLGLVDTYGAIWFPSLVSTFYMLIVRTYFENIPEEIEEASRIDGCGEWRLLLNIILPLSLPVLATISLFYGVGNWNAFMNVLIYLNSPEKYNLAVLVQQMVQSQMLLAELNFNQVEGSASQLTSEGIKTAAIVVMILPMLIVYPFVQKYFVKGVMIGAIKG